MQSTHWRAMVAACALCGVVAESEPARAPSLALYAPQMAVPKVPQMQNVPLAPVPQMKAPPQVPITQAMPEVREVSEMPQAYVVPDAVDQAQPYVPAQPIAEEPSSMPFIGGFAGGLAAGGALVYSLLNRNKQAQRALSVATAAAATCQSGAAHASVDGVTNLVAAN